MNPSTAGFLWGWLTLIAAYLIYRGAQGWLRQKRYGQAIDHSVVLVKYGQRLTKVQNSQELHHLLVDEISKDLKVGQAALLLLEAHKLVPVGGGEISLAVSHTAVRAVAATGEAQRATEGRLRELLAQMRIDLEWACVWVPLMRGTKLRGLWLLGARENGRQYAPEDLHWLTAVAREAAAVLETLHYTEQERLTASEMRTLYREMVKTREMERSRLSRELHDGVLQDLCAVSRDLKALDTQIEEDQTPFESLTMQTSNTVNALRAICSDLRPPLLQHALPAALQALVETLDKRSPAPVHIEMEPGEEDFQLPDEVALAIFRITQEALHNALQHADASEIAVRLTRYPDHLRLTVTDDGRGIAGGVEPARFVAQGHFGLAGMRERAAMIGAKLEVQSAVDYGTVVILELPLTEGLS